MSIRNAILRAVEKKKQRGYTKLYWAIDLHNSVIRNSNKHGSRQHDFFENAHKVLQNLSKQDAMVLILFTSSPDDTIQNARVMLKGHGVTISYVNCNPEFVGNDLCDFSRKFAFDIMVEDKAGFDAEHDWFEVEDTLRELNLWEEEDVA